MNLNNGGDLFFPVDPSGTLASSNQPQLNLYEQILHCCAKKNTDYKSQTVSGEQCLPSVNLLFKS